MELLQGAGTVKVLTPVSELQEQIMRIEKAGRTCYQSEQPREPDLADIPHDMPEAMHEAAKLQAIRQNSAENFVRRIMLRGHHSVIEHSACTVVFKNVSRGFTHEMVRHRLCAFSQRSTRYVNPCKKDGFRFVLPPSVGADNRIPCTDVFEGAGGVLDYNAHDIAQQLEHFYQGLLDAGLKPEDARQFLPIGIETELVVTTNFREWRHIFELRCAPAAHWEIRGVLLDLLVFFKLHVPVIVEDFGINKVVSKKGRLQYAARNVDYEWPQRKVGE